MSVIRPATANDVPVILQMIHDLAIYEKEPDAVRNTPEMLPEVLFGEHPRVFAAWPRTRPARSGASPSGS